MVFHNLLTCSAGQWMDCSMAMLGLVILFFVLAAARKWVFENMDMPFSFLFSIIGGVVSYIIAYGLSGSYKIALIAGLILGVVAGYFGSAILDDTGSGSQ